MLECKRWKWNRKWTLRLGIPAHFVGVRAFISVMGFCSIFIFLLSGFGLPLLTSTQAAKFDIVSIKLDPGGSAPVALAPPSPSRLSGDYTVAELIRAAYITYGAEPEHSAPLTIEVGSNVLQMGGSRLPSDVAWIDTDRYVITATSEANPPRQIMYGEMLRALLEDRFRLKTHRETRDVPLYALMVDSSGIKISHSVDGGCIPYDPGKTQMVPNSSMVLPADPSVTNINLGGRRLCGYANRTHSGASNRNVSIHAASIDMNDFARYLSRGLDRPVIDKSGLSGLFDVEVTASIDETTAGFLPLLPGGQLDPACLMRCVLPVGGGTPEPGVSIFTAFRQQLGLRLEASHGPVEFLILDHVERPTPD